MTNEEMSEIFEDVLTLEEAIEIATANPFTCSYEIEMQLPVWKLPNTLDWGWIPTLTHIEITFERELHCDMY